LVVEKYTSEKSGFAQERTKSQRWEVAEAPQRGAIGYSLLRLALPWYSLCMRILVTGASGLLGRSLMRVLVARRDVEVKGVAFSRAKPPLDRLDLTDQGAVALFFAQYLPEIVVHLAAERRPDVVDVELQKAQTINVDATRIVAHECSKCGAFLLLISTDYVYDGSSPPYYPSSPVHPLNAYGRMKLESEYVAERELFGGVLPSGERPVGAVLRIPILYGPVESLRESSVTEVALALKSNSPRKVEHWARRYPTHVDDVSAAILTVVDACLSGKRAFGPFPRFLLSGDQAYTKYEMAQIMATRLGLDASHLQPDPSPPSGAPRPRDCRMDSSLLESMGWHQEKKFESEIGGILRPFFGELDEKYCKQ